MQGKTTTRMTRTMFLAGLALALLFGAASADAQGREGRWEFTLGALYQLGSDADFEGGSTIETEDDFGFTLSTGYNINDKLNATLGFSYGEMTPFIGAGIGWSWIDTNVPTGLPESACWWDPWYGYICTTYQDTKTIDGFAYQLGAGLRYDINDMLAVHGSYRVTWVDIEQATSTPQFDGFQLSIGWKF